MSALLIGLACVGASAPMYATEEDLLPQCAQIERVSEASLPVWSIIMHDPGGRLWAIETDQTLIECWDAKPADSQSFTFTCEK